MAATINQVKDGYRLANGIFEAVISVSESVIGITALSQRGDIEREKISVTEAPLTLRLATDAPRVDFPDWQFHCASGEPLPVEADWGIALELHRKPTSNAAGPRAQRLTDTLVGPPWYTDIYYPGYCWYRRMVSLPAAWKGKPIVFVLGGGDGFDWRNYWIYLNGERIGQASYDTTYTSAFHEIPRYVIKPEDPHYAKLKFGDGEDNLLAVQARLLDRRTPEMNRLDLERYSGASMLVDQYVSGGEPTRDVTGFTVAHHNGSVADGTASLEIVLTHPSEHISITARYTLGPNDAALHKRIVVHNEGSVPLTLLEADVLSFSAGALQCAGGGFGWPIRIGENWFAGVCHPAGLAQFGKNGVRLQVLPGVTLDPTHSHDYVSKTAVVGIGNGRRAFADYLQSQGRRKPQFLNLYSLYGLCEIATGLFEKIELTEKLLLGSIQTMRQLQAREIKFDYYCIDTGWNDPLGDLKTFHPANFPHGGEKSLEQIRELGMKPLLWISPAQGPPAFRPGVQNPLLKPEDNIGASWFLCMAATRWRNMLRDAMLHHGKVNGVRGFKLDEVAFYCGRTNHGHLPNKYGVEATMDAFIDTLDSVRKQCPELLIMLYWRFESPWWLLYADTIYQRGLLMEGATPSDTPSRLIRQSITISLDQGHDWNWDSMPLISQDSLGVWLSNTRWGSWMGAEGWRGAWIMDFVRGNMMHQLWGDLALLDEQDLKFMQAIAAWTKENSAVLKHPKRILGSPWRAEPYGYACFEGGRGVIAIHNAQFKSINVQVPLDATVGLSPASQAYDVTWIYKDDSVEHRQKQTIGAGKLLDVSLAAFEVCMADVRPAGATSSPAGSTESAPALPSAAQGHNSPSRAQVRGLAARLRQTAFVKLDWSDPQAQKFLARVMNGRTTPTNTPDVIAVGPDRSDERDRDIFRENLEGSIAFPAETSASKLLVITRMDREGIAWHHLAPFEIIHITAMGDHQPLKLKTTPRKMHEQAGGWSWMLHEFDVPPGLGAVELAVDAVHPKSVSLEFDVWHSDE
jgi:hypothetical protein